MTAEITVYDPEQAAQSAQRVAELGSAAPLLPPEASDATFVVPDPVRTDLQQVHDVVQSMRMLLADAPNGLDRVDWDAYGLCLAFVTALRADCTRRRVGAVILNDDHRLVAAGYNGLPPGQDGCASAGACPRGQLSYAQVPAGTDGGSYTAGPGLCMAVHAEENACLDAGRPRAKGCTLYVTDEPCPKCRSIAAGAGIRRVVWPEGDWTP